MPNQPKRSVSLASRPEKRIGKKKEGCVPPPAGAQLQRSPACSHFTGDQERAPQASPTRTCWEGLQTWILRGRPAGEKNTQVCVSVCVCRSPPSAALTDQKTRRRPEFAGKVIQIRIAFTVLRVNVCLFGASQEMINICQRPSTSSGCFCLLLGKHVMVSCYSLESVCTGAVC